MIAVIQAELDPPSSPPETQNRLSVDHRAVADFYGLALLNVLRTKPGSLFLQNHRLERKDTYWYTYE